MVSYTFRCLILLTTRINAPEYTPVASALDRFKGHRGVTIRSHLLVQNNSVLN